MQNRISPLDKTQKQPLYLQLYQHLKQNIVNGRWRIGEKLPSKRKIAEYLAVSQNTVETAYGQLLAEGYIESKARSGFFVSFNADHFFAVKTVKPQPSAKIASRSFRYDLAPNQIDTALFPFAWWRKQMKNLLNPAQQAWLGLGDKQGETALRTQIRQYLYRSRGVDCSLEQIVIGAGVETCISQLILLFDHALHGQTLHYAMEQHGYPMVEKLLQVFRKKTLKLPLLDDKLNVDIALLQQSAVNVLYVTPSHQYPYGSILPINERHQLLEWANRQPDRYIIEDDYDSEFRYKGKPIPALQSLDQSGKVIYLGSFSKLLMPSLRITFMVLPPSLLAVYQRTCGLFNCTVPRLNQHLLAQFMQSGEFEKHIHKMRTRYRKKMERLCQLLRPYQADIRYYGEQSGVYLLLELYREVRTTAQLSQLAESAGIKVYPLPDSDKKYILFGFGNLDDEALSAVVPRLMQVWGYAASA
ncbi:MocR-like pyridoxine biosynthesis transcription factor PdxR [Pasteurella testudinis]|uniref:MocR-like pyridoxine biosynthesis transcription factor PdxR n=1 Tax=Pasteurella testudinis TaxID=761 RepID=UPI0040585932